MATTAYEIMISSSRSFDGARAVYSVKMLGHTLNADGTWSRNEALDAEASNSLEYSELLGTIEDHDKLVRKRLAQALADALMGVT